MKTSEPIELSRNCRVIQIPSGIQTTLGAGSVVRIMQQIGGSYTVATDYGHLYRVDAKDADALNLSPIAQPQERTDEKQSLSEQLVWEQLKTIYDPEIPVNIADLGLVYACQIFPLEQGGRRIEIRMSMTAPGCGMGNVLKADVEGKLSGLPDVREVDVQIVFDPPWHPGRMSEAARLQLGLDLDTSGSAFPTM